MQYCTSIYVNNMYKVALNIYLSNLISSGNTENTHMETQL